VRRRIPTALIALLAATALLPPASAGAAGAPTPPFPEEREAPAVTTQHGSHTHFSLEALRVGVGVWTFESMDFRMASCRAVDPAVADGCGWTLFGATNGHRECPEFFEERRDALSWHRFFAHHEAGGALTLFTAIHQLDLPETAHHWAKVCWYLTLGGSGHSRLVASTHLPINPI
jgi:hypothetical protein